MMTTANTFAYRHTVGFLAYRGRGFIHSIDLALDDGGVMYVLNRGGPEKSYGPPRLTPDWGT